MIVLPSSAIIIFNSYSMIYAMLGLSAGHIYRMVTDYGGYKLDFTGLGQQSICNYFNFIAQ